jgi:hypothetical protein
VDTAEWREPSKAARELTQEHGTVQTTVAIDRPVEDAFAVLAHFENPSMCNHAIEETIKMYPVRSGRARSMSPMAGRGVRFSWWPLWAKANPSNRRLGGPIPGVPASSQLLLAALARRTAVRCDNAGNQEGGMTVSISLSRYTQTTVESS